MTLMRAHEITFNNFEIIERTELRCKGYYCVRTDTNADARASVEGIVSSRHTEWVDLQLCAGHNQARINAALSARVQPQSRAGQCSLFPRDSETQAG